MAQVTKRPEWMKDWENVADPESRTGSSEKDCVRLPGGFIIAFDADTDELAAERARLAAAAPALARALLGMEWAAMDRDQEHVCAECWGLEHKHEDGCAVDAALTSAGFPDQVSRDDARRMIAEAKR